MAEDEIVTFRLPPKDREAIRRLVEGGAFQNRSDFVRYAIKSTLREYEPGRASAAVSLDLDGVELPTSEPASRRSAAPRARKGVNL